MRHYLLFFLIVGLNLFGVAKEDQTIDSLERVYHRTKQDTAKLRINIEQGDYYSDSYSDTALIIYGECLEMANQIINDAKLQKHNATPIRLKRIYLYHKIVSELAKFELMDSALSILTKALNEAEQISDTNAIIESQEWLGNTHLYVSSYDSALHYCKLALKNSKLINDSVTLSRNLYYMGDLMFYLSDYKKALSYIDSSLSIDLALNDSSGIAFNLQHKGMIQISLGNFNDALKNTHRASEIFKKTNQSIPYTNALSSIGNIYMQQGKNSLASSYYLKSFRVHDSIGEKDNKITNYYNLAIIFSDLKLHEKSIALNNKYLTYDTTRLYIVGRTLAHLSMGESFVHLKKYDKAEEHLDLAHDIISQMDDIYYLSMYYNSKGLLLLKKQMYEQSILSYQKALSIQKEIDDPYEVAVIFNQIGDINLESKKPSLAASYYHKALLNFQQNKEQYEICETYLKLGNLYYNQCNSLDRGNKNKLVDSIIHYAGISYRMATHMDILPFRESTSEILYKAYKHKGNASKAFFFADENMKVTQEIQQDHLSQDLVEYEMELLEQDKVSNLATINTQEENLEKQHKALIGTIIGLILTLIFISFIGYLLKKNKRNLMLITKRNAEINQQKEEILAQRDEIESQRDMVMDQKSRIEEVHHEISDSINYATRIQTTILPSQDILNKYFDESFIYFNPKDKVSGDFYWWHHTEGHTVITAADCTGHGVPGAFMSMLAISLLREIVTKEYITHAGVILNKMRKGIIKLLRQTGEIGEQKDGLDLALISVDHETGNCQYAGANNPLYLIRNGELTEYKSDRMPIAIHHNMSRFNTHEIKLIKGDQLYLFSDGYADQFGGEKGKKLKYKPFKQLLISNANRPMSEQLEVIKKTFDLWKGSLEQVDDVVVLGLKL